MLQLYFKIFISIHQINGVESIEFLLEEIFLNNKIYYYTVLVEKKLLHHTQRTVVIFTYKNHHYCWENFSTRIIVNYISLFSCIS